LATCVKLASVAAAAERHGLHQLFLVADGMAQYRRGEFLVSQGDKGGASRAHFERAQRSLEAALKGLPARAGGKRAQAAFLLALTLFRLQKETDARELLEQTNRDYRALKTEDTGSMHNLYMARLLRTEAFRVILGPAYERLQQAERSLAEGNTDAASEALADVLSTSKSSQLLLDEARTLVQQRDADGTLWIDALTKVIGKSPMSLELVRERAQQYVRNENYLAAGRDYVRYAPLIDEEQQSIHWLNTASLLALSGNEDTLIVNTANRWRESSAARRTGVKPAG
jgi:hypothetical protein